MARYKVLEKSYINNSIYEEGDVVEYDGIPSENLELVTGKKAKAEKQDDESEFSFESEKQGK
jgi:hypothetical protein